MNKQELQNEVKKLELKIEVLELEKQKGILEAEIEMLYWKKKAEHLEEYGPRVLQSHIGFTMQEPSC